MNGVRLDNIIGYSSPVLGFSTGAHSSDLLEHPAIVLVTE